VTIDCQHAVCAIELMLSAIRLSESAIYFRANFFCMKILYWYFVCRFEWCFLAQHILLSDDDVMSMQNILFVQFIENFLGNLILHADEYRNISAVWWHKILAS